MLRIGFNPRMLTLAREARGLTLSALAQQLQLSRSLLAKVENSAIPASEKALARITQELRLPYSFFLQRPYALPIVGINQCFGKRISSFAKLRQVKAAISILGMQIDNISFIIPLERFDPRKCLSIYSIPMQKNPEDLAREIRRNRRVSSGPLVNIIKMIEDLGVLVFYVHPEYIHIEGCSTLSRSGLPSMFIKYFDLQRDIPLVLGRQLYYLMNEIIGNRDMCFHFAERFARELILPARDIAPELRNLSLPSAIELKNRWRTSISSLIRRAVELNVISASSFNRLILEYRALGYDTLEPGRICLEPPSSFQKLLDILIELGYSCEDMAEIGHCSKDEIEYLIRQKPGV